MGTLPVDNDFLRLIQQNSGIIYKICHTYCRNPADRDDLAQEIIYQLWKSGKSYDTTYRFTTWMYRVALNVAISFSRSHGRLLPSISLLEDNIDVEDIPDITAGIQEENLRLLRQYILELKELDRALVLLYLENKSYAEIADITGLSETNVATKLNRIKDKLKQKFSTIKK
ncbi:MAG TPA: sigma-70 family RNA polymerase sigma factor [Chitinophagaceae bacterium]|nr:sigma-70 family RNA polymerase sigma factor [Chitinophagaceae bacterium]